MVSDGISRDSASNSTCYFSVGVFWVNGVQLVGFSRLCALVVSQSAVPYLGNPLGTGLLCLGAFIFWVVGGGGSCVHYQCRFKYCYQWYEMGHIGIVI